MSGLSRHLPWVLILAAIAVTYGEVLKLLVEDWIRDPNYTHGFLIPVISGYLIWSDREKLRATRIAPSTIGIFGVVLSAAIFILGVAGAEVFTQRVSFVLMLGSIVLLLQGWRRLRIVAFPIALILLAIPLPYVIYYGLTSPMQAFAAKFAIFGLKATGVQAASQGNMIHLAGDISLEVAEACSGIRSLYAFLALGALVAKATPVPLWGQVIIFLSTIPLSIAGNAVRVWGTGMGAWLIGPETTHGTIHELFGLIVFAVSLALFVILRKAATKVWSSEQSSS